MIIGVDATPLQNPHALRGIGSVVRNVIKHMPASKDEFIFYVHDIDSAKKTVGALIPKGISYSLEKHPGSRWQVSTKNLPGDTVVKKVLRKSKHLLSIFQKELPLPKGDSLNTYIQFDPNTALPHLSRHTEVRLFVHDLIPYVLEGDYLWGYKTARKNGLSRKAGLNRYFLRWSYVHTLKKNCRNAAKIFANSEHTKNDFVARLGVKGEKIIVTLLGAEKPTPTTNPAPPTHHYAHSDWGPIQREFHIPENQSFIFFAGGVDPRRKLKDLFAAYNNLRARGVDIALLLAGDTMTGSKNLPNDEARKYFLRNTSYHDRVFFLGHVSSSSLSWLYANATAFVFPSTYEGFGLPVIESAIHGTPVVTYRNSSLKEIGGDNVFYAENYLDITERVMTLSETRKTPSKNDSLLKKFNWAEVAKKIFT